MSRVCADTRSGFKLDNGKLEWSLLPITSLQEVVKVLMFGKAKYSEDNWKKVDNAPKRYLDAALRHILAVAEGEWLDEESKLPHLAHCICCLLFLLWFRKSAKEVNTFQLEDLQQVETLLDALQTGHPDLYEPYEELHDKVRLAELDTTAT